MSKKPIEEKQPYSFRHPLARRVKTQLTEGSVVQQEFAEECDINRLVEKHVRSGVGFPQSSLEQFADVSDVPDYQQAQEAVLKAQNAWYSLDASIRRYFNDKPENFLRALHDKNQHDELVRLKVFKKPEAAPPQGTGGSPEGGGAIAPGTVAT